MVANFTLLLMLSWPDVFQFSIFWVLLLLSPGVSRLGGFLQVLAILFSCYLSIRSSCYVLSVPIPCFCFLCFQLFICLWAFSIDLLVNFSFAILEDPVLLALFDSIPVSFEYPFFRQYILLYLFQLYCQSCMLLSFFFFFYSFHSIVFLYSVSGLIFSSPNSLGMVMSHYLWSWFF